MPDVTLVVRGGSVVGPDGVARADVAVDGATVAAVGPSIDPPRGARVLDAGGCLVGPGLVDLHTHLRQPGREEAETVETGARAAALGGFTAVVAMPNTEPPLDSAGVVAEVLAFGRGTLADVAVAGAITVGRAGKALAPMGELADLGITLFTDDGTGVQDGALDAPSPRLRQGPRRDAGPALRGPRRSPVAVRCTRAAGRAGWGSRASRRRRRRAWSPGTSRSSG